MIERLQHHVAHLPLQAELVHGQHPCLLQELREQLVRLEERDLDGLDVADLAAVHLYTPEQVVDGTAALVQ